MKKERRYNEGDQCIVDSKIGAQACAAIPSVVEKILAACGQKNRHAHLDQTPIPSQEGVIQILSRVRRIFFPGYFSPSRLDPSHLVYSLGQETAELYDELSNQILLSIQHDCMRKLQPCSSCIERSRETALRFIQALPDIKGILDTDVEAALEGDPAAKSYDEIIFSYPGVFAITVYRTAHRLYELEVPLIPRMMTEHAHGSTGIDIHPGAKIGGSFFIDHGTGVVVGETTEIGRHVRLYQGVTLGALSLPRDAANRFRNRKRHPTIEDDVIIYSNATILGKDAVIGARSIIGGNVWITERVPPDTKVLLKRPELIYIGGKKMKRNGSGGKK